MIIDIDKQKRWFVKFKDEDKWVTKYFGRGWIAQKEAEEFVKGSNKESPENKPINSDKNDLSMLDIIPKLKAELIINGRTERYANDLERIVKRSGLGLKPIRELRFEDFSHYSQFTLITRNRYLSYLKVVLNYAEREGIIPRNPLWKWRKPKEKARKNPLSLEDLEMIKKVAAPHLKWAIEVAQNLGVRCGKTELFSLEWNKVNYEHKYIQVYATKTKSWRKIPFTSSFGERLKRMQMVARTPYICEYWSPQYNIARPIERIHKSWRTALKRAGIKYNCVFYDVRHLFATTLLNRGADLISVSAILGHASAKMTADVYAHSTEQGMRKAVSLLNQESSDN